MCLRWVWVWRTAGQSRSVHKSQGAVRQVSGRQTEYFKLIAGDTFSNSIVDGIDISWAGRNVPTRWWLKQYWSILSFFTRTAASTLVAVRKKIERSLTNTGAEKNWKRLTVRYSTVQAYGRALCSNRRAVAGACICPFTLHVIGAHMPRYTKCFHWVNTDSTRYAAWVGHTADIWAYAYYFHQNAALTQPYWLANPPSEQDVFSVPTIHYWVAQTPKWALRLTKAVRWCAGFSCKSTPLITKTGSGKRECSRAICG